MKINYRTTGTITKAGMATIEWDEKIKEPRRCKEVITLPVDKSEIYQVDPSFSQFLFLSPDQQKCWFGGTDELPFLVRLTPHDWKHDWSKDRFYEQITPEIIKRFDSLYKGKVKRQGDIFAYELPKELQDIEKLQAIMLIDDRVNNMSTYNKISLFHTRHCLEGEITCHYKYPVARGIVRAPDHADLNLSNWHVLAQTVGLYDPPKAD